MVRRNFLVVTHFPPLTNIIACLESSTYEVNSGGMDANMSLHPAKHDGVHLVVVENISGKTN